MLCSKILPSCSSDKYVLQRAHVLEPSLSGLCQSKVEMWKCGKGGTVRKLWKRGRKKKPLRRRDAGKREEEGRGMAAGKKGPKDEKKTLKSGRNCRRRSSFNNALLRQKRGGNDSGGGRSQRRKDLGGVQLSHLTLTHHQNSDQRPTWRSPEVEIGWDRGEMEGLSLSPSLDLACLSVIGGLGKPQSKGGNRERLLCPPSLESIQRNDLEVE